MRLTDLNNDISRGGAEGTAGFSGEFALSDGTQVLGQRSAFHRSSSVAALAIDLPSSAGDGQRSIHLALKRTLDILGAGFGLLLLAPLLLFVAAVIKFSSKGPVFFRQQRTGLGNEPFEILKFRSMYTDRCDLTGVAQTTADDPRITPIGRIIRRTNIDELPQLINVLKGDMSLVGPRPHVPGMLAAGRPYEELVLGYDRRHAMRPGITGLAQCEGLRGPTTEVEPSVMRVVKDFEYIRDFSIWLDIRILSRTVINELLRGNGF